MLKKTFFTVVIALMSCVGAQAQSDSTDLNLYMTAAVLETPLDSILYGDGSFEQLNLDFAVDDTVTFSKVHVTLKQVGTNHILFKHVYSITELQAEALISAWDISIPFGNLDNALAYSVAIIIEDYDGSLSSTINKTLIP